MCAPNGEQAQHKMPTNGLDLSCSSQYYTGKDGLTAPELKAHDNIELSSISQASSREGERQLGLR